MNEDQSQHGLKREDPVPSPLTYLKGMNLSAISTVPLWGDASTDDGEEDKYWGECDVRITTTRRRMVRHEQIYVTTSSR